MKGLVVPFYVYSCHVRERSKGVTEVKLVGKKVIYFIKPTDKTGKTIEDFRPSLQV